METTLYVADGQGQYLPADPDTICAEAVRIGTPQRGDALISSAISRRWAQALCLGYEREVFICVFLDNRHRVLAHETLFYGTIDGASVYPREVVKAAILHGAGAVLLIHNHPSGVAEPSRADTRLTERLREALGLVDVRIIDHLIVGDEVTSFTERGLL